MIVEFQFNCTGPWVDYSNYVDVSDLKRDISLSSAKDPQKSQTGNVEVFGQAYTDVYNHLIDNPDMYSNSICVRITDTECSNDMYYFKIDNSNLKWCDDGECRFTFSLEGYEPELDCARETNVADNWQGWFQAYPAHPNPYVHPRFRYCDLFKPTLLFGLIISLVGVVDTIINFLNSITPIGNIPSLTPLLAGCRKGHPAPFISTYIYNVCAKCGITVDDTTAPVFFDTIDPIIGSGSNPYYYATLLTAPTTKGVPMVGNKDYIETNKPSWSLTDMSSRLKDIWNARWFIHNSKFYFHRKDKIGDLIWGSTPVLDFTTDVDKQLIVDSPCFSWNGQGKLARLYLKYANDATDAIGNELLKRFNGEWLNTTPNPNYTEAKTQSMAEFGAASFVLDGQDSDYDDILVNWVNNGPDIEVRLKMTTDTCEHAKILIYDPASDAKDATVLATGYIPYLGLPPFGDDAPISGSILPWQLVNANYPMSFDQQAAAFQNNLWLYWSIDVPTNSKKTNIAFEFTVKYCCALNTLNLYQKVKFANGSIGEIEQVTFDHANRNIKVKGNLL